ncbi:MAG: hypothetical protein ACTMUB_09685 [cyanobacterium endosymbiont of Rhopalodia musculus]|uniref:hypothetical protein n=1 Tax=cyanobacterium endosymbiont of Epithemia clementina EcSB TaxID=3034674 RepID=UPI0024803F57|nr:hypothetical protein [cyanobacterium endosymbiont of Epithemia clementina EcSB]WGT68313.1 hypothetical protein P3F56_04470 [cyanobacterium endosymbiont of Epithemia clementina EcSB]
MSKTYPFLGIVIFYIIILLFFLFFGDRVGWEGDDIDQLDGIINFSYKGKNLVYRYYWQPLTYQLNLWLNSWLKHPRLLFFIPQIIGAANISILLMAVYIFSGRRLNLILCFCFLIIFPEILFCSLYYNSTVFAMFPMSITILLLFWTESPIKAKKIWNYFRYFAIGITSTIAVFFRLDFLLSLPLLWYLMLFDDSLEQKIEQRLKFYFIYILTSFSLLAIFSFTDILNLTKIIYITTSHHEGVNTWTIQQSLTNLFSVTNLVIWIILIISLICLTLTKIKNKDWKLVLLILCVLPLFYSLPSLTSPKYLMPGIIFLPFFCASTTLKIKSKLDKNQFQSLVFSFITLSLFLQIVAIQLVPRIPFIEITANPNFIYTHDGIRVPGGYLKGYNEVKKAQINSSHRPIKFARKMAEVIQKIDKNVTLIYLDKSDSFATEVWIWTFTTFYLKLEGYQVEHYDRDNKIVLSLADKTVIMQKVNQEQYEKYLDINPEKTTLIKVPYISHKDPQGLKKFFEDFYDSLDKLASRY